MAKCDAKHTEYQPAGDEFIKAREGNKSTEESDYAKAIKPILGPISVSIHDYSEITSRLIIKIKDYLAEIWKERICSLAQQPDQTRWELKFVRPLSSSGIRLKFSVEGNKFANFSDEDFDDLHLVVTTIMHTGPTLLIDLSGGFLPTILDRTVPIELTTVISDAIRLQLEYAGVIWPYRKINPYGIQFNDILLTDSLRLASALNVVIRE